MKKEDVESRGKWEKCSSPSRQENQVQSQGGSHATLSLTLLPSHKCTYIIIVCDSPL